MNSGENMLIQQKVDRYYEMRKQLIADQAGMNSSFAEEWYRLCEDLFHHILEQNVDVLYRLKDR